MSAALATSGRLAKRASRALRNVRAAEGEDATTTPAVPILRYMMGPYFRARAARPECGDGPMSGSAPRIGRLGGPGGRRREEEEEVVEERERRARWRRRQRKKQERMTGSVKNVASGAMVDGLE